VRTIKEAVGVAFASSAFVFTSLAVFAIFSFNFPELATCTNFHCSDSEFLIRICRA
jgi:hypothetical protein